VTDRGRPRGDDITDSLIDDLTSRVLDLEEAAASPLTAERLGQALRESAERYAYAGPTFRERHTEAVRTEWLARISRRGDPRRKR
jgi:hypothetical protein